MDTDFRPRNLVQSPLKKIYFLYLHISLVPYMDSTQNLDNGTLQPPYLSRPNTVTKWLVYNASRPTKHQYNFCSSCTIMPPVSSFILLYFGCLLSSTLCKSSVFYLPICICKHLCIYFFICVCMYISTRTHVYIYVYTHICISNSIYIFIYVYIKIQIDMHI